MWKQILGVEVEIQQMEGATFLEELAGGGHRAFGGLGWAADYPDPHKFLDVLFHSDCRANYWGYSNPDVDALLEAARIEQDVDLRMAIYQ